jgi:hypothetical protein
MANKKINELPFLTASVKGQQVISERATGKMYQSGSQRVFHVADYGMDASNSDNTTQLQNCINACVGAGGGIIWIPWAATTYRISGALITSLNSVNPNCQLYFPLQTISTAMVSVKIMGEAPPNFFTEGAGSTPRSLQGVILESTIQGTGTRPAVFGTPWVNQGVVGNRNYIKVEFENLIVRTSTKSGSTNIVGTMTAINFFNLCAFNAKNLKVDITSQLTLMAEPTNNTCGIVYPYKNNKSELSNEGIVFAEGYTNGIIPGEHSVFLNAIAVGCKNGIFFDGPNQDYAVSFMRLQCELNNNNIVINQNIDVSILQLESEHYLLTDKWYTFAKDIKYISGDSLITVFNSTGGTSFVGKSRDNSLFIVDSSANAKILNGWGQNVGYAAFP